MTSTQHNDKETAEDWINGFENLSFEESAIRIKDKILESDELDDKSKKYFNDAFCYVMDIHKKNKPLDINLMRIHMQEIKQYKQFKFEEFARTLLMLGLCGFSFGNINDKKDETK